MGHVFGHQSISIFSFCLWRREARDHSIVIVEGQRVLTPSCEMWEIREELGVSDNHVSWKTAPVRPQGSIAVAVGHSLRMKQAVGNTAGSTT